MERNAEEIRMTKHWNQVQKQQTEAQVLRIEIADLQRELDCKLPVLNKVCDLEGCLRRALWQKPTDLVSSVWNGCLQFCMV